MILDLYLSIFEENTLHLLQLLSVAIAASCPSSFSFILVFDAEFRFCYLRSKFVYTLQI